MSTWLKRLSAALLCCVLITGAALAAEWPEGCGPARPYADKEPVDLDREMGYFLLYPAASVGGSPAALEARLYCCALEIYLPREDIALGKGKMVLYRDGRAVQTIDAQDQTCVKLRPISEEELSGLHWGGGMCVEAALDQSLAFDSSYSVTLEAGFFTAAEGRIINLPIGEKDGWMPGMTGDYGVGGLQYTGQGAHWMGKDGILVKRVPQAGDEINFDVVLGGDAKSAVLYSMNDTVLFDQVEFTQSCHVIGQALADGADWNVMFLDGQGKPIGDVHLSY